MGLIKSELFTIEQNSLAAYAKVLGHPARIAILQYLLQQQQCICNDLVQEIGLAQATISQHLKALKDSGLIPGHRRRHQRLLLFKSCRVATVTAGIGQFSNPKNKRVLLLLTTPAFFIFFIYKKQCIMNLSAVKTALENLSEIAFQLPDGSLVPSHFHVTEVGKISKHFMDCGGTVRQEERINFQLWNDQDYDHRLHPEKLSHIIKLSEKTLGLGDQEIEVEFQGSATIAKYSLDFDGKHFLLRGQQTDCLARESCAPTPKKGILNLTSKIANSSCAPDAGCC